MEEIFKMNIVQNLITLEIILRKDNALREKNNYFIEHWLVGVSISFANTISKKSEWQSLLNLKCHRNMKDSDI